MTDLKFQDKVMKTWFSAGKEREELRLVEINKVKGRELLDCFCGEQKIRFFTKWKVGKELVYVGSCHTLDLVFLKCKTDHKQTSEKKLVLKIYRKFLKLGLKGIDDILRFKGYGNIQIETEGMQTDFVEGVQDEVFSNQITGNPIKEENISESESDDSSHYSSSDSDDDDLDYDLFVPEYDFSEPEIEEVYPFRFEFIPKVEFSSEEEIYERRWRRKKKRKREGYQNNSYKKRRFF